MKRKILLAILMIALIIPIALSFASSDYLVPLSDSVYANKTMGFRINLTNLTEEKYGGPFKIVIKVAPRDPEVTLELKEDMDMAVNHVAGTYKISSADLYENDPEPTETTANTNVINPEEITEEEPTEAPTEATTGTARFQALHFLIRPDASTEKKTEYTLNAQIVNQEGEILDEESFVFTVKVPKVSDSDDSGDTDTDSDSDDDLKYKGSADYYLKSLSVSGYSFTNQFNKTRDTYFVTVGNPVSSLDVKAIANDSKSRVDIVGNDNVSEDMSKITISVRAENGKTKIYRIYVKHGSGDNK